MQRHSGLRKQLILEEPVGSVVRLEVGSYLLRCMWPGGPPWPRPLGSMLGMGPELYPKVMGTQEGLMLESERSGQAFLCLLWSSSLKPSHRSRGP